MRTVCCRTRSRCVTVLLYVGKSVLVCERVRVHAPMPVVVGASVLRSLGKWASMPASHTAVLLCSYSCLSLSSVAYFFIWLPVLLCFDFLGHTGWYNGAVRALCIVCLRSKLVMDYKGLSQPHLWICYCVNRYSIDAKQLANMEEINLEQIKRFL